jgi:hypothetical protein
MIDSIFQRGGPYDIRRVGNGLSEFSIPIEPDEDGRVARACPEDSCSPGYFKVRNGTGITENHTLTFCPYCRRSEVPNDFATKEQRRYGEEILVREAQKGIERVLAKGFGLGPSGRKRIGGGMFSMEISMKPGALPTVRRPYEDEVRRDVVCPHCSLDHAVFGIATWCPDCGEDIFMTHVAAEFNVVRTMLGDVARRKEQFGARIAAKDIENCLEDTVSIFEAVMKTFVGRFLRDSGKSEEEVSGALKKVGNAFQSPKRGAEKAKEYLDVELFGALDGKEAATLAAIFEKRHPITHNLGVVDRKYLERAQQAEQEGRDIRLTSEEILYAVELCEKTLKSLHGGVFPSWPKDA